MSDPRFTATAGNMDRWTSILRAEAFRARRNFIAASDREPYADREPPLVSDPSRSQPVRAGSQTDFESHATGGSRSSSGDSAFSGPSRSSVAGAARSDWGALSGRSGATHPESEPANGAPTPRSAALDANTGAILANTEALRSLRALVASDATEHMSPDVGGHALAIGAISL